MQRFAVRLALAALAALALFTPRPAAADADYTFTTIDVPGAVDIDRWLMGSRTELAPQLAHFATSSGVMTFFSQSTKNLSALDCPMAAVRAALNFVSPIPFTSGVSTSSM